MDCKLLLVRIFVSDWPRAVRFYTETLGLALSFADEKLGWAQLATGDASLALERFVPEPGDLEGDLVGRFVGVSLAVAESQLLETVPAPRRRRSVAQSAAAASQPGQSPSTP